MQLCGTNLIIFTIITLIFSRDKLLKCIMKTTVQGVRNEFKDYTKENLYLKLKMQRKKKMMTFKTLFDGRFFFFVLGGFFPFFFFFLITRFVNDVAQRKQSFPITWRGYITEGRIITHSRMRKREHRKKSKICHWSGAHGQEASQKEVNTDFVMLEQYMLLCHKTWDLSHLKADLN